jgi:hypothetical protein
MLVKHLLYTEKFTIDGARQRVDQYRRTGELRASARKAFEAEMVQDLRSSIEEIMGILDGKTPRQGSGAGGQAGGAPDA